MGKSKLYYWFFWQVWFRAVMYAAIVLHWLGWRIEIVVGREYNE